LRVAKVGIEQGKEKQPHYRNNPVHSGQPL
jgi:hypothetical protein